LQYIDTMTERRSKPISALIAAESRNPWLLSALLALFTLILYRPVVHYDFIGLDDSEYILRNAHVNTGFSMNNFVWAFTSFYSANWHPLTWISHMADCQLLGLRAGAHHGVNLALHVVNVLLLFVLLRKGTGAPLRSFVVAVLFAVHPLNVETVAWISERKSLLCMLFSLLTVAAYVRYVRASSGMRYLTVLVGFALALMSKPMAVTLPVALLLLDHWPLVRLQELPFGQRWLRLSVEKLPLFLLSAASSVVTILAQRAGGAITQLVTLPLLVRVEGVPKAYVAYLGKMFWPWRLSVYYPNLLEGKNSLPVAEVIASMVVLTGVTALVLYLRGARYLVTGWLLFLVTLLPVSGVVQVGHQAMADRYAYFPFIGLFIILAWGSADIAEAVSAPRAMPAIVLLCAAFAFGVVSRHYLRYWQNGISLLSHARNVAVSPDVLIENALADALDRAGRADEAFQHYRLSCELFPGNPFCHYSMARILFEESQYSQAISECHIAAGLAYRREPQIAIACLNKSGAVMMDLGALDAAERDVNAALSLDPQDETAWRLREEIRRRREKGRQLSPKIPF
jgi:hypothetical protein